MNCAACGWPTAEVEVLSTHLTSEGVVRYRRCPCGSLTMELAVPVASQVATGGGWAVAPDR